MILVLMSQRLTQSISCLLTLYSDGCQPPNLVNTLISIALSPGTVTEPMFKDQDTLQVFLLLLAFACVPILLCGKPCVLRQRSKKRDHGPLSRQLVHDESGSDHGDHSHSSGGGHDEDHGKCGVIAMLDFALVVGYPVLKTLTKDVTFLLS